SRPTLSVPSQCAAPGRASALPRFCLSGSYGATAGAATAIASAAVRIAAPSLVDTDAGIQEAIEDVDQKITHDEAHGDQQDHALHGGIVAGGDGRPPRAARGGG